MDKLDLGDTMPLGFCSTCLERMARGASYGSIRLPQGRVILHAYCEHRQVGGSLVLRDGWPRRWNLTTPIDVLDWRQLLKLKSEALSQYLEAEEPAIPAESVKPVAKELLN